jgi:hypothetical protein
VAQPLPQSGDDREDRAALIAAAVTAVFAAAEAALIASIVSAVRKTLTGATAAAAAMNGRRSVLSPATAPAAKAIGQRLERQSAAVLATAEQRAGQIVASTGPGPVPGSVTEAIGNASETAHETTASAYREAVARALAGTRGGLPASSLSLSRIQAAQKALDGLLGDGITGFTDSAGRNWDLVSYVEMATRTAVSNAYDGLQAAALTRAGKDLVTVGTHSTEGSCPACLPWLGKVLSLTGATAGYPTLAQAKAAGWRHPQCRCDFTPLGAGVAADVTNPVPEAQAAEAYKASQRQRALERNVRAAGRRQQLAITPQARGKARRELAAARAASAAHRARYGVRQTQAGVRRREHPYRAH